MTYLRYVTCDNLFYEIRDLEKFDGDNEIDPDWSIMLTNILKSKEEIVVFS